QSLHKVDAQAPEHLAFSRDGRFLAVARPDRTITVLEMATLEPLRELRGHESVVTGLAFDPSCRLLASGSTDTTVLPWDLSPGTGRAAPLAKGDRDKAWEALAKQNGPGAQKALDALADDRDATLTLLEANLKPVSKVLEEQLKRWIEDLDHPDFARREKAT